MSSGTLRARALGFTLVEAIIAITILGILGAAVAVFIRAPIQSYVDTSQRVALTDAADATVRRVMRDVQTALPNSFRSTAAGSGSCFEFLPVLAGGRYRVEKDGGNDVNDDILKFNGNDNSFDVLGHRGLDALPAGTNLVAIYNLGIPDGDAYAGDTTAAFTAPVTFPAPGGAVARIQLAANKKFPFESPGRRFQVIPNYAVVYSCAGTSLYRSTRAISPGKMASCPNTGEVLVANVNCGTSSFSFEPAVTQRNGVLTFSLELFAPNGETVRLYNQVSVSNVP